MFKRAGLHLPNSNIFPSNAWDSGTFLDLRTPQQSGNLNAKAHSYRGRKLQMRSFADVRSGDGSNDQCESLPWPAVSSATSIPTPYQIFHLDKNGIYSKRRFYELVKMYHPDRHISEQKNAQISPLSNDVRVERYRLIIAAHVILSDPVKRTAYDRYGLGWGKHAEVASPKYRPSYRNRYRNKWTGFETDESPMTNGTWEDWEKWYQRHDPEKQEPMYFSNGTFVSMVVVLASLSGFIQITQMGDVSFATLGQEAMTAECLKNLQSRRTTSRELNNKNDRLQRFLESRIPYSNDMFEPEDDIQSGLLSPPEL